jgi:hypothetical protein
MKPTRKKIVNPGHQAALTIEKQFTYQFRRHIWNQFDQSWIQAIIQVQDQLQPDFTVQSWIQAIIQVQDQLQPDFTASGNFNSRSPA